MGVAISFCQPAPGWELPVWERGGLQLVSGRGVEGDVSEFV